MAFSFSRCSACCIMARALSSASRARIANSSTSRLAFAASCFARSASCCAAIMIPSNSAILIAACRSMFCFARSTSSMPNLCNRYFSALIRASFSMTSCCFSFRNCSSLASVISPCLRSATCSNCAVLSFIFASCFTSASLSKLYNSPRWVSAILFCNCCKYSTASDAASACALALISSTLTGRICGITGTGLGFGD